jgi:branched-chain amino acid transport system permease protein
VPWPVGRLLQIIGHVAPELPGIVQLAIAIVGAIPVCIGVSIIIERIAYRRLRNAPRLAPLITAIGVSILLQTFAMMIWGRNPLPFPQVLPVEPITHTRRLDHANSSITLVIGYGLDDLADAAG